MYRMFHAALAVFVCAVPAFAQEPALLPPMTPAPATTTTAVVVPQGPYLGVWTGPFYGYYPGAYRGFWSNGYSLYGPPVPTYGAIPGVFGGADQRLSNYPDMNYMFLNPYGMRGGYVPLGTPKVILVTRPLAVCEIRLPDPDAEVKINGNVWGGAGSVRKFELDMAPGVGANYEIEARWAGNAGIGAGKRAIIMRTGETAIADFTKPGT